MCHATVKAKPRNIEAHLTKGVAIATNTAVLLNCCVYGEVLGPMIVYKFLESVKNFVCTNKPVFCKLCESFVWSYNMKNHYYYTHNAMPVPAENEAELPT